MQQTTDCRRPSESSIGIGAEKQLSSMHNKMFEKAEKMCHCHPLYYIIASNVKLFKLYGSCSNNAQRIYDIAFIKLSTSIF